MQYAKKKTIIQGEIDDFGAAPPGSCCRLCGSKSTLLIIGVSPPPGQLMGTNVVICGKCIATAINHLQGPTPDKANL